MRSRIWWTSPSARIRPLLISRMFAGHRLDLVQDVARDDDALARAGPVANHPDGAAAGQRVHARQRLVENEQLRIVDDGLRQLDPLAHALAVGANLLVGRVHQVHGRQRTPGRIVCLFIGEAVQPDERTHPLETGHPLVEGVLLRTETDGEVEVRVAPDRLAEHLHDALARLELAGDELHERRLAGAVRAEQAGDPGRHFDADVVQADDLPVPLRDVVGRDNWWHQVTTSTPRTRRSSTEIDSTMRPRITVSETCHGVV